MLPLVYIFEEARNILINNTVDISNLIQAYILNMVYIIISITLFFYSFNKARDKGTLINIGE